MRKPSRSFLIENRYLWKVIILAISYITVILKILEHYAVRNSSCGGIGRSPESMVLKRNLLLAALVFFLCGCGLMDSSEDGAAITVGKRHISAAELKVEVGRLALEMEIPERSGKEVFHALLERIVDTYLILEYGREKGMDVSQEELETKVKEIRRDYPQKAFQEIFLERYIDVDEWKEALRRQILVRKILKSVSEGITPIPVQDIKAYFDTHQDEFKTPPMIKFRQIILGSRAEAEEMRSLLKEGADMGELARKHSSISSLQTANEAVWIPEEAMEKVIAEAIFSLPVGETSRVVETSYGFHIFEVIDKRPGGHKSLPEAMPEIESRLYYEKESAFCREWLKGLRNRFPVRTNQEILKTMELG